MDTLIVINMMFIGYVDTLILIAKLAMILDVMKSRLYIVDQNPGDGLLKLDRSTNQC